MSAPRDALPPIAIVGAGALFPGRGTTIGFWKDVLEGVDSISDVPSTHWLIDDYYDANPAAPDKTYGKRGGFLSPRAFDPLGFGVPPAQMPATDTAQLLALIVAKEALEQARGSTLKGLDPERTSVVLGVASATELVAHMSNRLQRPAWVKAMREAGLPESQVQAIADGIAANYTPWQEATFPGLLGNVVAGRVANRLDLGGANYVTDAACASSLSAVHVALHELYAGTSDCVLAGGVDALNDILMYMCFSKTPALSPSGDCRPFSDKADGTILGEGVGMVALRRLADAERDGNRIYAVLRGIGAGSDGRATAIYAPLPEGQARTLRRTYEAAGYSPSTVELVEAHGTGTRAGDAAELKALTAVFSEAGAQPEGCAIGSIKSQIGHAKAAAGAASLIKAALALHHGVLPPTIKVERPNPAFTTETSPFYVNSRARPWIRGGDHPRRASVSSFGFGGSNFHLALEEYTGPAKAPRMRALPAELALFSSDSDAALAALVKSAQAEVETDDDLARLADASHKSFKPSAPKRLAIVSRSAADFQAKAAQAVERLSAPTRTPWPADLAYGSGAPVEGDIAFLFPGQGSQYVGMSADLAMAFPAARAAWDRAVDVRELRTSPLHKLAFPPPRFSDDARATDEARLTRMENAQPALAAASLALLNVLNRIGVKPALAAGHSFGEVMALHAAGAFDAATALAVAQRRGAAMAAAAASSAGSMLAVTAGRAQVEALVRELGLDVVVANDNAPDQVVLSGATAAIATAEKALAAQGLTLKRLNVASAFHSEIVAGAMAPFRAELTRRPMSAGRIPVYSNVTSAPYPDDPAAMADLLAEQLIRPVRFREEVAALYAAGARIFVEVGAGSVLTRLVGACLPGKGVTAVALDARRENGVVSLWRGLGKLAAAGVAFDLSALLADQPAPAKPAARPRHAVDISGANYGKPYPPKGGAKDLPQPNPETASSPAAPVPAPAPAAANDKTLAPMASTSPTPPTAVPAPPRSDAAAIYADLAAKHEAYVAALTRAHEAFLQASTALVSMLTTPPGVLPAAVPAAIPAPVAPPVVAAAPTPPVQPVVPVAVEPPPVEIPSAPAPVAAPAPKPQGAVALLRAIVAEKTGYPEDLLADHMDLEAELGVDSIKQVEILAALRERAPSLPEVDPSRLATLRSIAAIAAFLGDAPPATPAPAPMSVPAPASSAEAKPAALASPAPSAGPGASALLRAIVAEKTGYPEDLLADHMDLEAELGVDSIKQVEILAALRERAPNLPEVDPSRLATLRSIAAIAAFLGEGPAPAPSTDKPVAAPATPTAAAPAPAAIQPSAGAAALLRAIVAEKTGYPEELLADHMDLEAELGVDSIKQVEILAALRERAPNLPEVDPSRLATLRSIAAIATFLGEAAADAPTAPALEAAPAPVAPASRLRTRSLDVRARPAAGVALAGLLDAKLVEVTEDGGDFAEALVAALEARGRAAVLVETPSGEADAVIITSGVVAGRPSLDLHWAALAHAQAASPRFAELGAALVTVQDTGGSFAVLGGPREAAWRGGLTGLAKTAAREWPGLAVKAIDVDAGKDAHGAAERVSDELLAGGAEIEVGLSSAHGRVTPTLVEDAAPPPAANDGAPARDGMVIIASGGARGVTAQALLALARRVRLRVALLGRTEPAPWPVDLPQTLDEKALRGELARRRAAAGGSEATPASIAAEARRFAASREIAATLEALKALGSETVYLSLDVADAKEVKAALAKVRGLWGPVEGVIHGAGALADKRIPDKTKAQFKDVFRPKVAGLKALLDGTSADPVRVIAVFSSVAGRFGNVGQADYAMANETLARVAWSEARRRPQCLVRVFDWGPWDGGMVDAALKRRFESAGVELIPTDAGAELFADALTAPDGGAVERIVGGAIPAAERRASAEVALSAAHPLLADHRIDGHAVLPAMMALDWLAGLAQAAWPDAGSLTIESFEVLSGVVVEDAVRLRLDAVSDPADPGRLLLTLATADGRLRYRATARPATDDAADRAPVTAEGEVWALALADAYDGPLFHGPAFQALSMLVTEGETGAEAEAITTVLSGRATGVDVVSLDAGLQAALLWGLDRLGGGSLPTRFDRFTSVADARPGEPVRLVLRSRLLDGKRARHDVAWYAGRKLLALMEGLEMTTARALARTARPAAR
jgi:acyl transferase domain-containing protein/NADP-dependent 3-hydroxy acid dehydrogenase YdfG